LSPAHRLRWCGGRTRLARLAAVFVAVAAAACGKTEDVGPADVAMQFYVTLELSGVREVPEPRALLALEPYLSDSLTVALRRARARRDGGAAPTGGASPVTDGNPFSGFFEGHSTYRVRGASTRGDTALVTMAFSNVDQKPAVEWTDTLVVVRNGRGVAARWRIADLRYGTTWEFGHRGTLLQVLREP
jgi:hypothetical protein